ncbi:MAG: DUF5674 family protein [Bacteroidetes bacterium]|nr:DUF5674 family protein [Bacteroidota bacterium]MCL1968956.1 DUF5674 family protein [Bacteroidota bacterium]
MLIVEDVISRKELGVLAENLLGDMVKAVVDIEKEVLILDAELHADMEALLLENGSEQENLWGINLYPDMDGEDFIEFDSMINIKPRQGNRSRGVEDVNVRNRIIEIINNKTEKDVT